MDFSRNERIAMASFLQTMCIIDENSSEASKKRINLIKSYLGWEEIEDKAEAMDTDKACDIMCKVSSNKKWYLYTMALWIANADDEVSKEESKFVHTICEACEIPKLPEGKVNEIMDDIVESVKNPTPKEQKTAVYYQKQYQADHDLDHSTKFWDGIIPESAVEMAGALLFCKQHTHYECEIKTLRRLVEMCEMDYTDAPEVQKVMPGVKTLLAEIDETNQKKAQKAELFKKIRISLWILAAVLVIIQAIFWGWWTILSGIVTVVIIGLINLLALDD